MERRDDIGNALRGEAPGRAGPPAELRGRIDEALGTSGPGYDRLPGGAVRTTSAVAAIAVVLGGAVLWIGSMPGSAPVEPQDPNGGVIAQTETPNEAAINARELGMEAFRSLALDREDPLAREAKLIWVDLQRFRATVEGPVRTMASLGKTL